MKSGIRSLFLRISVSLIALGLIVFFLHDKLSEALIILRHEVNWGWFSLGVVIFFIGLLVISLRLQLVFKVQKVIISFRETLYLGIVGLFFNLFFPSALGGDIAKAYYASKYSGKKIESITSIFLDRLMGFVALTGMAVLAIWFFRNEFKDPRLGQAVYFFLALMLLVVAFFGSRRFARLFSLLQNLIPSEKLRARLSEIYHAINGYRHHLNILFISILLSVIGQSMFVIVHYLVALSLDVYLNPWIFFLLVPMISVISMAPSIGGLGVREAGAIYLFSRFMSAERALALSILVDLIIYGFSFVSGILFSFRGGIQAKAIHEMEELE